MSLEHDREALATYLIGALDDEERAAIEAHLSGCSSCQGEARELQRVVMALARAVPQHTPPKELRARVLRGVGVAGEPDPGAGTPASAPFAWSDTRVWLPLAAMLVVALGLGAHAIRLQDRVDTLESHLIDAQKQAADAQRTTFEARRVAAETQSAMSVLAAPDLARIDLSGQPAAPHASARALWSRQRGMVFTAANLPSVPAGRVYQVWVVTGEGPISAGLLEPDASGGGFRVFHTPSDIPPPVAVAVTLEPAGGVPAPTGEKVLVGTPAPAP